MEITSALLCDHAMVREGLLHVLGGGISRVYSPQIPAPLGVTAAFVIDLDQEEATVPHEVHVEIRGDQGDLVGDFMAAIQVIALRTEAGEHMNAVAKFPLNSYPVPRYGRYDLTITVDMGVSRVLTLWVLHPDELNLPAL